MFLGLLLVLAFSYAFSWLMAIIGLKVKTQEAVQPAVFVLVFPLVFASSVFVPTQTMPGWLQAFAENQPITIMANALRGLVLGEGALEAGQTTLGQVTLAILWVIGMLAVFAPIAVRVYRRTVGSAA